MLSTEAVGTVTLELIRTLQGKPYLAGFCLVGGTALALKLNHRRSIDIDLFSDFSFNASELLEKIHQDFPFQIHFTDLNTLKGSIGDVRVDILAHRYPWIEKRVDLKGIFLASTPDIIAMKLNAISTSGQRSKDFIDIFYLLDHYTLPEMLRFYTKKYNQNNTAHVLKSMIYFDDADLADWPVLIKDPKLKWDRVKRKIEQKVMDYVRSENKPSP